MRKWLYYLVFCFSFLGCFEDESNLKITELHPIRIENIKLSEGYTVYTGDTLRIEPLIFCEGVPDTEMDFKWELSGEMLVPTVIGTNMYLNAQIAAPSTADAYTLKLTVTDRTTGIARIESFRIYVLNPYGEGIIIADTKDGQTSDLSLVMSREFNSQISKSDSRIRIFRNVWSLNNGGQPLAGKVLDCITSSYSTNRSMTVLTTERILRADYHDFVNIPEEEETGLFYAVPPHIGHGYTHGGFSFYSLRSDEIMNANGKLTGRSLQNNVRKYTYTLYPPKLQDYNVTLMYAAQLFPAYCYDDLGKQLLLCDGQKVEQIKEQSAGSVFDVRDLSDYEPFYLGRMSQGITLLTKQKSTGAYKGLVMQMQRNSDAQFAKAIFDFSAASEIESAKFFDLNQLEDVIYYATETRLYATPTATINARVQWELPSGSAEKITGIQVVRFNAGNRMEERMDEQGQTSSAFQSTAYRTILIYTYNETTGEGKVICVPIKAVGSGTLEQNRAYHVTLSGFNKVTGVYKQNK